MLKILFGFLPWILYFILLGTTPQQHEIAIITALAATLLFGFHELKKGFILSWGTILFFGLLLIVSLSVSSTWLERYANLFANSGLTVIAWLSLIINKPFTLQYAREQVAKEFWKSPLFIRINQIITTIWAMSFSIALVMNLLQLYSLISNNWIYQILSYIPIIFAIVFTKKFPDWYKERKVNKIINKSEQAQKTNPFLMGNFAPVTDEIDATELIVEGEIPQDLLGVYMRNGPNPAYPPFSYTYPFDGDGMLHVIYIKGGKASYKNRFIITDQLKAERREGKTIYGGVECPFVRNNKLLKPSDPTMPVKIGRFIHIIRNAKQYLALHEAASAYEVDAQLNTLGVWNPTHENEAIEVNAHTRLDPETGELFFISYHGDKPIVSYHIFDKNAKLTFSGSFEVPYSCMIHDFVLTKNYIIIFLCPVIVDFANLFKGKHLGEWQPDFGTRIAVLSRTHLTNGVTWIDSEPFFTYHFANAYEKDQSIIVDHVRYPKFEMYAQNSPPGNLYRTSLHIAQKKCHHQQLDDNNIEFPRINENTNSRFNRYIYTAANMNKRIPADFFTALIKYDLTSENSVIHDFGNDYEIDEAVFAPKVNSQNEDDGYLMFFIYNKVENNSEFLILNAQDITAKFIAKIKLPRRVPHGLHGSWFAGAW